jgi:hypothetical protein
MEVRVWSLSVTCDTAAAAVRALAVHENRIADVVDGEGAVYTLILFPEALEDVDGGVRRTVHLAAVKGVYAPGVAGPLEGKNGTVTQAVFHR